VVRRAVTLALVLLMLVPAVAVAGNGKPLRKQEPGRVPSAQLQAKGSGMIVVNGRMSVTGWIPGKGTIEVTDRAGDAALFVSGSAQPFTRGRVRIARVRRATGRVYIRGSNVTGRIVGDGLDFIIAGYGRARLAGSGQYQLNNGDWADWTGDWIRLAPSPSSEARRSRRCAECSSSAVRPH